MTLVSRVVTRDSIENNETKNEPPVINWIATDYIELKVVRIKVRVERHEIDVVLVVKVNLVGLVHEEHSQTIRVLQIEPNPKVQEKGQRI